MAPAAGVLVVVAFGFARLRESAVSHRATPQFSETVLRKQRATPLHATRIVWQPSFEAAMKKAKAENKPVMVDFYATWCGACRLMDEQTYPDHEVIAASRDFVSVKVDVDKRQDVAASYGISSLPTVAWLQGDGKPVSAVIGAYSSGDFVEAMRQAQMKFKKLNP